MAWARIRHIAPRMSFHSVQTIKQCNQAVVYNSRFSGTKLKVHVVQILFTISLVDYLYMWNRFLSIRWFQW